MHLKSLLLLAFCCYNCVFSDLYTTQDTTTKMECPHLKFLGVLPGHGWDGLRNMEMGPVLAPIKYSECLITNDGQYLIPDHYFTIPLKTSNVELYSEVIDNFSNFSSVTSISMDINAGGSFLGLAAQGSFSKDYQTTKQRQVDDKSITTRVSARYTLYKIGVDVTNNIQPELHAKFYEAIEAIERNNTAKADLILELVVRDKGTHFISMVDAGAVLVKEDFILTQFMNTYVDNKQAIKAAASASFLDIFNFDGSYKSETDEQTKTGYSKATTSSNVKTYGGQMYRPNMTLGSWIDTVDKNMVSIDRIGDPLHFLITPEAFPNVSVHTVLRLRMELAKAITDYYSYNSHKGCMDLGSPGFDYDANVGKICEPSPNNFTFGGVFQSCTMNSGFAEDICKNQLFQKNIVTGDFSCQANYTSVPIKTGTVEKIPRRCWEECYRVWFHDECNTVCEARSIATYTAYWCAALSGPVPVDSGMMFGGLYTSTKVNPVTQSKSCPPTYFDLKILQELHICIGNDYELGKKFSLDFGGFFSCQNGNPLYDILKSLLRFSKFADTTQTNDLLKACPKEYTQHTAVIEDDCLVYYCVKGGSFRIHGILPIVLPPFRNYTNILDNNSTFVPNDISESSITFLGVFIGLIAIVPLIVLAVISRVIFLKIKKRRENLLTSVQVDDDGDGETSNLIENNQDETA